MPPFSSFLNKAFEIPKLATTISLYLQAHDNAEPQLRGTTYRAPETLEFDKPVDQLNQAAQDLLRLAKGAEAYSNGRDAIPL